MSEDLGGRQTYISAHEASSLVETGISNPYLQVFGLKTNTICLKSSQAWRIHREKIRRENKRCKIKGMRSLMTWKSRNPVNPISSRKNNALLSSQIAARLQPHLQPYEWSFWTDACLRGPKPVKHDGCGFCVVHCRFDNSHPSDGDFAIAWWQSCFVARNVHQIGHAEMLTMAQALEIVVDQCERISGTVVTRARIKVPGAA